jgi:Fe-S cluster assembly protein SufD
MATGRQHMDFHTRIDHTQPHGTSKEFYKGILDGRSRGVFNGRVYVHRDAQKTDAEQSNKNLLLSRNAEIDTKPQLEIYADDVKCAHGATVGQLDENMIFYLRSRGIDATAARSLLTYGFASEVLDAMALVPVKEGLRSQLLEWLPNAEQVRELVQ